MAVSALCSGKRSHRGDGAKLKFEKKKIIINEIRQEIVFRQVVT